MGLPMIQVLMIIARQMSRPISDRFMFYGREHPAFRNRILVPMGRKIANISTRLRMKNLGLGTPETIAPVSEATALEQASEFVQQVVILCYSLGVFAVYHYYMKRNERELAYQEDLAAVKEGFETRLIELSQQVELLHRDVHALAKKGGWGLLPGSRSTSLPSLEGTAGKGGSTPRPSTAAAAPTPPPPPPPAPTTSAINREEAMKRINKQTQSDKMREVNL